MNVYYYYLFLESWFQSKVAVASNILMFLVYTLVRTLSEVGDGKNIVIKRKQGGGGKLFGWE